MDVVHRQRALEKKREEVGWFRNEQASAEQRCQRPGYYSSRFFVHTYSVGRMLHDLDHARSVTTQQPSMSQNILRSSAENLSNLSQHQHPPHPHALSLGIPAQHSHVRAYYSLLQSHSSPPIPFFCLSIIPFLLNFLRITCSDAFACILILLYII